MRFASALGWMAGTIMVLTALKSALGYGAALVVATAAFSFCIGALWGAGQHKDTAHDR